MIGVAALAVVLLAAPAGADASRLNVAEKSAFPGQIVELAGKGLDAKKAKVSIGGTKAKIATRSKKRLGAIVPSLKPGKVPVVAKSKARTLRGTLRVEEGIGERLHPVLDSARAAGAEIGPAGGAVEATDADGTRFELTIPAGAVSSPTTITLTPVIRLRGLNLSGKPVAVQFSPDGLEFATPATLRITLAREAEGKLVGLAFDGTGRELGLRQLEVSGNTLTLAVEHFSGAAATPFSVSDFVAMMARLVSNVGRLALADYLEFARAMSLMQAQFNFNCAQDSTCAWLFGLAEDEAEDEVARTPCDPPGTSSGSLRLETMARMIEIDALARLVGSNHLVNLYQQARQCETRNLVDEIVSAAQSDPLANTQVTPINFTDQGRADAESDGDVNNCEWAIYVARAAALQGFATEEGRAIDACKSGLHDVLDRGIALCRQDQPAGLELLKKGDKPAEALRLLFNEFADAIDDCQPKITVSPSNPTVEVGKTQAFSATSTDPADTSFTWTASDGQIGSSTGSFTAPTSPGQVTVTATSTTHPDSKGTATVTVACPDGEENVNGVCKEVTVTVNPSQVTLDPGDSRQFTATVTGIADQSVTWSASGGLIDQTGVYVAPSQPGNYTVTAQSVAFPDNVGAATVTVAAAVVQLGHRFASISTDTLLLPQACPPGGQGIRDSGSGVFTGVWDLGQVTSACGSADQTSDVERRADGQAWLHFEGSAQASTPDSHRRNLSQSEHRIKFDVLATHGATLHCGGGFSASYPPAAGVGLRFYLTSGEELDNETVSATVGWNHHFDQGTNYELRIELNAATPATTTPMTATGAADITCDFDKPVQ